MRGRYVDSSFIRGATQRRLNRRDVLRISGLSAAALALAACGVKGQNTPQVNSTDFWSGKNKNGTLNFANWPLYMDPELPELAAFTEETGIEVNYEEVIEEMGPWFAKLQPQLAAGQSVGYDLMVITNGIQFKQFVQSNFLAPLDLAQLPNYTANAAPAYKQTSYDPGNKFSVPWASGMTGIAYDPEKTGRPITKLADLWDPAFAGKVGMFSDAQELANFGLLVLGLDPKTSTPDDWEAAAAKLEEQKDAGIIRKYYDQSYIDALASGEVWITQAWSGDVLQRNISDGTNFEFVIPEEGGTIWTDNFAIPITAENPVDALMCIDFFYRTDVAATLTEYIGYVTPVPDTQALIEEHAAEADNEEDKAYLEAIAASPLVFPDAATLANLHYYVDFEDISAQQEFLGIFEAIVIT